MYFIANQSSVLWKSSSQTEGVERGRKREKYLNFTSNCKPVFASVNKFNIMNRIQCPVTDKKMKKTKKKLARVNQTGEMTE